MLPGKLAFIDIETTGGRSFYDRIIEIGILRVENNKLVKTYNSLLNPQTHLPKEIEFLTGIRSHDLEYAPTFRQIKDDVLETLDDCIFVAHNVRFDYGFLRNEFKREDISFSAKHFCTVRLSRLLYPRFTKHNLDALIERFGIPCENRHRALDDAKVLYHFYNKLQKEIPTEQLAEVIKKSLKKPSLPLKLPFKALENLPEKPGVYIFYGENGMPLYVGKSKNIRDRVHSHFSSDIHSPIEMNISQQVVSLETTTTAGELGALILESKLIKKLLPLYNRKSRIKRELVGLKSRIDSQGYQECYLEPISTIQPEDTETFLGFFKSKKQAKAFLTEASREYALCEKLLGLEKTKKDCFGFRLKRCNGACTGVEKPLVYNLRFLTAFSQTRIKSWPFKQAILIEENEFDPDSIGVEGVKEYFIVNKWCYMGSVVVDKEGNKKTDFSKSLVFDPDTYKILRQFIKNPNNRKKIRLIPDGQLPLVLNNYFYLPNS